MGTIEQVLNGQGRCRGSGLPAVPAPYLGRQSYGLVELGECPLCHGFPRRTKGGRLYVHRPDWWALHEDERAAEREAGQSGGEATP